MKFGTKIIHGYNMIDESTGASSISICQASTFHQNDIDDAQKYTYSRFGNPTREALEDAIAKVLKKQNTDLLFHQGWQQ